MVEEQSQILSDKQRKMLYQLLCRFKELSLGRLGAWKESLVNMARKEEVKPYHSRPYRIPQALIPVLKKVVTWLESISPNPILEWAAPSFAIPKKKGTMCFISDSWRINKLAKWKLSPLHRNQDILHSIEPMRSATAINCPWTIITCI